MISALVIRTNDFSKSYSSVEAVRGLSLCVGSNRITGFLGRSGAGKSTIIKMLLGMLKPAAGDGTVLGKRIDDPGESLELRRHVAYVSEDKRLYAYMTVEQMIRFTRSFYSAWRTDVEKTLLIEIRIASGPKGQVPFEGNADEACFTAGIVTTAGTVDSR